MGADAGSRRTNDRGGSPRPAMRGGWLGGASGAVADYGVSALSGFTVNVLLARALGAQSFGSFAVAFAAWMVIGQLHAAAFAEPMLILAPQRSPSARPGYLAGVVRLHGLFVAVGAALLFLGAGACWLAGRPADAGALAGAAIACPGLASIQLVRRACYLEGHTGRAVLVGIVQVGLALPGLLVLQAVGQLSPPTALIVLGGGWLAASSLGRGELAPGATPDALGDVMAAHRRYATAGATSSLLNWIPFNLWFVLLPVVMTGPAGLAAGGVLRATMQVVQPTLQANGALATFLLPRFSRDAALREPRRTARLVGAIAAPSALFAAALWAWGGHVLRLLFGDAIAVDLATLRILSFVPIVYAAAAILRARAMAAGAPRLPLVANVVAAIVAATIGPSLIARHGAAGAAASMLACFLVQAAALVVLSSRPWGAPREGDLNSRGGS